MEPIAAGCPLEPLECRGGDHIKSVDTLLAGWRSSIGPVSASTAASPKPQRQARLNSSLQQPGWIVGLPWAVAL
jgi:hypothetical protein